MAHKLQAFGINEKLIIRIKHHLLMKIKQVSCF